MQVDQHTEVRILSVTLEPEEVVGAEVCKFTTEELKFQFTEMSSVSILSNCGALSANKVRALRNRAPWVVLNPLADLQQMAREAAENSVAGKPTQS
jgi:hypothetical protein